MEEAENYLIFFVFQMIPPNLRGGKIKIISQIYIYIFKEDLNF